MVLVKPRLTDFYNIPLQQEKVDFAIPTLDEDIPLYLDPFLLWKSPSQQDQSLHISIVNALNNIGRLSISGNRDEALKQLIISSECNEVGMGLSGSRKGKRIGEKKAAEILSLFENIPQYQKHGFTHFEEIQLYIDGISKDRISDFGCNIIKSFLIDFTIEQCEKLNIPMKDTNINEVYDFRSMKFNDSENVKLPINPETNAPSIFVPKRWLRFSPWINFNDYFKSYCPMDDVVNPSAKFDRVRILNFNRNNYGVIKQYIKEKERTFEDCKNDPLFKQIPVTSAKAKFKAIKNLPTGKTNNADRKYEDLICQLMASLMYPHLDFAAEQSRTESGSIIRDLIFHNNREHPFLKDIYDDYGSKQVVMEIKNVKSIERDHVNQLNRYMADDLGKFGILVTRNPLSKARQKSIIDLWSGQRKTIIVINDIDLEQMVEVFESKQRHPLEVIKAKYIQFRRDCPS